MRGKVGVGKLTKVYGGRRRRGSRPCIFSRGSASIIRKALLQLESAGFVEKYKKDESQGGEYIGRQVTRVGQRHLNQIADKVYTNLKKAPAF
ncbi:40S ribosomal protein S19, partial [Salmonella sp. s51228]|uniref:40S ribosomal protein S19 n=1 Tax=Salmonella sp. s51228 TaxID=3159652 RepID=UPI0039808B6F